MSKMFFFVHFELLYFFIAAVKLLIEDFQEKMRNSFNKSMRSQISLIDVLFDW